jgi:hypothetical protein
MMKTTKPLLPLDSPLYLRRLARELNSQGDNGFYYQSVRYSAARLRKGQLQGYRPAAYLDPQDPRAARINPWRDLDSVLLPSISDAYGRTICASRAQ